VHLCSSEPVAASALTGVITDPRTLDLPAPNHRARRSRVRGIAPAALSDGEPVALVKSPDHTPLPDFDPIDDEMELPVLRGVEGRLCDPLRRGGYVPPGRHRHWRPPHPLRRATEDRPRTHPHSHCHQPHPHRRLVDRATTRPHPDITPRCPRRCRMSNWATGSVDVLEEHEVRLVRVLTPLVRPLWYGRGESGVDRGAEARPPVHRRQLSYPKRNREARSRGEDQRPVPDGRRPSAPGAGRSVRGRCPRASRWCAVPGGRQSRPPRSG
jgi:hypothetical protein